MASGRSRGAAGPQRQRGQGLGVQRVRGMQRMRDVLKDDKLGHRVRDLRGSARRALGARARFGTALALPSLPAASAASAWPRGARCYRRRKLPAGRRQLVVPPRLAGQAPRSAVRGAGRGSPVAARTQEDDEGRQVERLGPAHLLEEHRPEAGVQPTRDTLLGRQPRQRAAHARRVPGLRDQADARRLQRAQRNVGEEFGNRARRLRAGTGRPPLQALPHS